MIIIIGSIFGGELVCFFGGGGGGEVELFAEKASPAPPP